VVAEDALARAGLRAVAEASGLIVVAEATPDQLDARADFEDLDVAVCEVGGTDALERIRPLAVQAGVVAVLGSDEHAPDALAAGARGVLLRDHIADRLGPAVQAVAAGLLAMDEGVGESVLRSPPVPSGTLVEPLTPREEQVLQLLADGLTNRRIGERLGISEHTAKFHVNSILGKLGARSRGEAIAQAARLGLLLL
jgi:two-component system nitrate/nitrite response regulator NarL